ncbi:ParE toxin of type II toxin-antitoxin system, parDE [Nitrosomonas sp. PY1]|uniref:type II toxin-antitoxin system RelE/ParE family toxin n=1 Tax=Nitrosomonas sp. PY1 TaxID=1803906 RepID=UPI001FC81D35|nr:type II toxin-antitoxin system RelE/ParE family toxin [Nitrosomonas sp. PY1]GKS68577.1 ParE toxin of type II toxin-antitoxin system, parDE [Nitrosomonas sp. PY1]
MIKWTTSAERNIVKVYDFLARSNPKAAVQTVKLLIEGIEKIDAFPQLGIRLEDFKPREVRHIIIGDYEIRYESTDKAIFVLRLWHSREYR